MGERTPGDLSRKAAGSLIRNFFLLTMGLAIGVGAGFSAGAARSSGPGEPPLRLVALGDSITAGYGVEPMKTYPELVAEGLRARAGRDVLVRNLGVNGLRAGGLVELLREDAQYREAVAAADVITINIGTNDLTMARGAYYDGTCGGTDNRACLSQARRTFREQIGEIAAEVQRLKAPGAEVVVLDLYFFYFTESVLGSKYSPPLSLENETEQAGLALRAFNDTLRATAKGAGYRSATAQVAFNGEGGEESPLERGVVLPPPDGVHPSKRGHAALAAAVLEALAP